MLHPDLKFKWNQFTCIPSIDSYSNNQRKAIQLIDPEDGSNIAVATVNIPEATIADDEVIIKNYSENEGIEEALIEAGIIDAPIVKTVQTGYVTCNVHKLLIS